MIQNFLNLYQWFRDPCHLMDQKMRQNQLNFSLQIPGVGNSFVVGEPALIASIQKEKRLIGGHGTRFLKPIVGDSSLIALWGEEHRKHRTLLQKYFVHSQTSRWEKTTEKIARLKLQSLQVNSEYFAVELLDEVVRNVLIETLFSSPNEEWMQELSQAVLAWKNSLRHMFLLFLPPLQNQLFGFLGWNEFTEKRSRVLSLIQEFIGQKNYPKSSLAGSFIDEARGAGLSETSIMWELVSLLMFGHDTTSVVAAWTIYYIESNFEVRQALVSSSEADQEALLKLCIQEALRLSPPVVHLTRVAICDLQVETLKLKKNDRVFPATYISQRNPIFFPEPLKFNPWRFERFTPPGHAFFPFGSGDRICIGKNMALSNILILLKTLYETYEIQLLSKNQRPVRRHVLMMPNEGTLIKLKRQMHVNKLRNEGRCL